ncbi:hypothetical protein AMURIS_02042 [Acetatifactor muris]|uniref:Uncharacterized protein n=1 Tax=Acetatifactor muris TaxID=879566 RepID=A0A2K4ZFT6_9FIRM|nr:hypothetical protein AMURIS_02042 [Acetatifactor muris]
MRYHITQYALKEGNAMLLTKRWRPQGRGKRMNHKENRNLKTII